MQSFQTTDLSVSTLIKYFCKSNPNCSEITQIQNFIKKLESSLNTPVNSENSNEILLALSSLGNIGYSHQTDLITSIFLVDCEFVIQIFLMLENNFNRLICFRMKCHLNYSA